MLVTYIRSIVLYIIVLIVTRIMGKREIGQLQPFEFVISIMIADLATIPMSEVGVPILDGIIPIFSLLIMHLIITVLNLKSIKFRSIVCGKPTLLIEKGKINENILEKERLDLSELQEKLREKDVFNLGDVDYVILETNGEISIILKPEKRNATLQEMNLKAEIEGLTYNLILDGRILHNNLRKIGKNEKWLQKQINNYKAKIDEVLIATINEKGDFYCQKKLRFEKEKISFEKGKGSNN